MFLAVNAVLAALLWLAAALTALWNRRAQTFASHGFALLAFTTAASFTLFGVLNFVITFGAP